MKYLPSPRIARDAAILSARKAGRSLRSLAAEFGVSMETIRQAEFRAERRQRGKRELSVRAMNVIWGSLPDARLKFDSYHDNFIDASAVARRVAEMGKAAFRAQYNCGKTTVAEIETWIRKYGFRWGPELDLGIGEYRVEDEMTAADVRRRSRTEANNV